MAASSDKQKKLLAFDFDHSLVDNNTDIYVIKLSPEGKVPDEVKALYSDSGWITYMREIFKHLHANGTTKDDILNCMSEIELTDGMAQLLQYTSKNEFDHIIISDCNSVFISHILGIKNLSSIFLEVYTNPARFMENGLLSLQGYHHQDWCSLSSENLCKGHILKNFIENQKKASVEYSHIYYVGDGFNDLCPTLTLGEEDVVFARSNFKLNSILESVLEKDTGSPVPKSAVKAKVVSWKTGLDILRYVQT